MEILIVLLCVAAFLAVLGGVAFVLYKAVDGFCRVPTVLRGHVLAALLWTGITFCQTVSLLGNRYTPNPIGHVVLFIAGTVMVASWKQFFERRGGATLRQSRRSLLERLFVQTVWGTFALGAAVWGVRFGANALMERAFTARNFQAVRALNTSHVASLSSDALNVWLLEAIHTGNAPMVSECLSLGDANTIDRYVVAEAVRGKSSLVTEILLRHWKESGNTLAECGVVHNAIETGNVKQLQTVLDCGGDLNESDVEDRQTPLQFAKKRGDKAMIAVLKHAGARQ